MGDVLVIPPGKFLRKRMPEILSADQKLADHTGGCPDCQTGQMCPVGRQLYNNDALAAWREVVHAVKDNQPQPKAGA